MNKQIQSPSLKELPSPPVGRTGWPWTEEPPPSHDQKIGIDLFPRITVVTPSFNQGVYLEETIRSVLLQGYPNLEYIVIDGGSTDSSRIIIQKYSRWLAHWVSEPDNGQAHAISKGFQLATGEIEAYLNSDDVLLPMALRRVAELFANDSSTTWIAGQSLFFTNNPSEPVRIFAPSPVRMPEFIFGQSIPQQSTFWRSSARQAVGFDINWQFCLDTLFFSKLLERFGSPLLVHELWAGFRLHPASKSAMLGDTLRTEITALAHYWMNRYQGWQRLWLYHTWRVWRVRHAYSSYLAGRPCFGKHQDKLDLLKMAASYPPGILHRQTLGSLRRMLLSAICSTGADGKTQHI
jgi:glycosyltransferase involved in cell wall biosynthesis